ncbi:MAG: NAD(P)H-hydrate dehydratase [Candidatus Levybacteria bacterium RBG_16_35_11]|nr:MAG: NAD(P)H-hydrate dehydratase [Candidatus Levybacteria bacterium RBG_16_35_11]
MEKFDPNELKNLYKPSLSSHKGQNGKLMIIGGSHLFHAASLWSLKVASRIVDMVFYSSVPENNQIVQKAKEEFRDGIVVPRDKIDHYINESDCVLIGPGLPRKEGEDGKDDDTKELTQRLLKHYPEKKWVIDGGSLQVISSSFLPKKSIITPHHLEFKSLFNTEGTEKTVQKMAKKCSCAVLLKGESDYVSDGDKTVQIKGGNAGMTKGGTGDVLAGLVAALYCKNSAFLSACAGSFINKKAGEELHRRVGPYFNASDLTEEIPHVMKNLLIDI